MRLLFPKLNYMVYIYIHAYIIAIDAGPAIFYISHDTIFHWGLVEHDHTVFNNLLINQPHTWNNLVAICLFLLSSAASLSLSLFLTQNYTPKNQNGISDCCCHGYHFYCYYHVKDLGNLYGSVLEAICPD